MKCPRCGGYGIITSYKHVEGGICFLCNGAGKITDIQHNEYQQDENQKAARREKAWAIRETQLQAQKELHEQRLKSGYYKAKREAEEQTRINKLNTKYGKEHGECILQTTDQALKEFFKQFEE